MGRNLNCFLPLLQFQEGIIDKYTCKHVDPDLKFILNQVMCPLTPNTETSGLSMQNYLEKLLIYKLPSSSDLTIPIVP